MRLKVTKSKNSASLYVIKSIYNSKTQSNSSKIIEKLGTETELRESSTVQTHRKFNDKDGRVFITTQSIKKLKEHQRKWALASDGWKLPGDGRLRNALGL